MSQYSYFQFSIKNEKYQLYKKIGAFIFFLNGLSFFYVSTADVPPFTRLLTMVLGGLLILYAGYAFFTKSTDKTYIVLSIVSALAWVTEFGFYTPAVILLALLILQILAQFKIFLSVEKDGVRIKTFSEKTLEWKEIENLVLKDGLLSIDQANGKMIQVEPDLTEPVIIQKGGTLNQSKWNVGEEYPKLEKAVNDFYLAQTAKFS